ncbi:MAG: EAL domain-containing protein, partial [Notoacmeibacter sp.]
ETGTSTDLISKIRDGLHKSIFSSIRALESIAVGSKHTVVVFDQETEKREIERKETIKKIESLLLRDGFDCAYQPIIDLKTGTTSSFEVLARWPFSELQAVSPDVFIPLIEELGMIDQFSDQILDKALNAASQWPEKTGLSVNVSRLQLADNKMVPRIIQKLKRAGISPSRLTVEITESTELGDIEFSRASIQHMRREGICVAVDDFGAGFANLNFLHDIEFDVIKIDRKIISEITTNPKDQAILRGIVAMTSALNTELTAEGVETKEIATMLRKIGVNKAQGYLFARPMREIDALEWINTGARAPKEKPVKLLVAA